MTYAVSAPDASGTPLLVVQRTSYGPRPLPIFSRYLAPVGPPPITLTGASILQIATSLARGTLYPSYTTDDGQVLGVYIVEKARSRTTKKSTDGETMSRVYLIHGSSDPVAVTDIGPQVGDQDDTYPAFIVDERNAIPYATGGGEADIVILTVSFSNPGPPERSGGSNDNGFSYEFGSESEHIDRAIAQVHYSGDAERVSDLINVTDDEVQGVDINAPIIDIAEEHIFTEAEFSPSVRRQFRDHLQKTNAETFREWAAGEVLFVGASARKQAKRWHVSYQFRVRRNVDSLLIQVYSKAGIVSTVDVLKRGWNYLWIETIRLPAAGASPTSMRVVPHAVHVATVYDSVAFSLLGIGTDPLP